MGILKQKTQQNMKFLFSLLLTSLTSSALGYTEETPYTLLADHGDWEERLYPPTRWVSTQALDPMPHDGPEHARAFWRLFAYIDGGNIEDAKIPMTAPVSMMISPGEGPNCESNFTMSFLIPADMQKETPSPTDASVYIEERPEMRFVTKMFGGFPSELDYTRQASELYALASAGGLSPKDVPLWTAGYSGPGVIINRRNEVWLEV